MTTKTETNYTIIRVINGGEYPVGWSKSRYDIEKKLSDFNSRSSHQHYLITQ